MNKRLDASILSFIREVVATLAALLIVVPLFLLGSGVIGWLFMLLAEAAGIAPVLWFRRLEEKDRRYRREREAFLASAHLRHYVLTPHRMSMLLERGASEDVVADLQPLLNDGDPMRGTDFLALVPKQIGEERFRDASQIHRRGV